MTQGGIVQPRKRPAEGEAVSWVILALNEDEAKLKMSGLQKHLEEKTVPINEFLSNWRATKDTAPVELLNPAKADKNERWTWKIFYDQVS